MNKKSEIYSAEEIINFKINKRKKDLIIEEKNYLIYKIK